MERCPTQAVLPLVGLAAEKVIRDRYNRLLDNHSERTNHEFPCSFNCPDDGMYHRHPLLLVTARPGARARGNGSAASGHRRDHGG
ncbi:MAG: hypothetical protein R6U98_05455 [Pirellulaceae bacterium]